MLSIRHTGIYVKDLTAMKDFYCSCFGMQIVSEGIENGSYIENLLGNPELSINVCKLRFPDGTMLELIEPDRDGDKDAHSSNVINCGCVHIAFTVKDLQILYNKLAKLGITFISQPMLSPDGKVYVCFCQDPEGNYLELVQEL
ncbi:MAG: VOC family protein [Lachnospiraceae bacterium]|nr:VOC family protein [Lachnospiraceae bacterium]